MQDVLNSIGTEAQCPIALIIREKQVLLGHRHYTPDKWQTISVWTCPGGRCDSGETLECALRREVAEETGITDLVIEEYLGEYLGAKEGDLVPVFRCSTKMSVKNTEPHKFSEWRWFSFDTFPSTFINNDVSTLIKTLLH